MSPPGAHQVSGAQGTELAQSGVGAEGDECPIGGERPERPERREPVGGDGHGHDEPPDINFHVFS